MSRFHLYSILLGLLVCVSCSGKTGMGEFTDVPPETLCDESGNFDGEQVRVIATIDWVVLCGDATQSCNNIGASISCGSPDGKAIAVVEPGGGIYRCSAPAPEFEVCNDLRFRSGSEKAVVRGTFRDDAFLVPLEGNDSQMFEYTIEFETFGAAEF